MMSEQQTAFQQRWLIVMERQAEDDDIGLSYCLWLRSLDGVEQTAVRFQTLDELFDALFSYWDEPSVISS